jgi:hypothetical protein
MRINHPLILKSLFGSPKILYFIVFKRNTAVISPINHHDFYGRAAKRLIFQQGGGKIRG